MHDDKIYHYSLHPLISCSRMHREAIEKIARRGFTPEEQKLYNARQKARAKADTAPASATAEVSPGVIFEPQAYKNGAH